MTTQPSEQPRCGHPHITRYSSPDAPVRLWACDDCSRRFYPACPECVTVGHRDEKPEAAAPDPVASPADDWVICQTCEGDGGWPTSAAPVPLDHGYSPRPDWAGTCPRCGAKAGDNCAVLTDPVAGPAPLDVEWLARALHVSAPETHHRRKCIDRHDLRAADIAAEYARLGQPVAEEPA